VNEALAAYFAGAAGTPEYFAEHVGKETIEWADVIRRAGIKGDF
jgi:hypothetical protein